MPKFLAFLLLLSLSAPLTRAGGSENLYLEALVDFERHANTIWTTATHANAPASTGYWGDGKSEGNGGIRGIGGVAISEAVLVRAFPAATNRTERLGRIRQALEYAAQTHQTGPNVCVDNKKWGYGWQTALWAGSMGFACMLVETELPDATAQMVKRAVADEATYRAGIAPASGYVGDTKSEENGWNANVLALAAAWLTNDTRNATWLTAAKKYLANTYTTADSINGPLGPWITTTTLYPDYSLENHGFYHPTYQMVGGMSMGDSLLMARLANPAVAAELKPFAEHNVLKVWTNLNRLVLDSGELAYPSGLDWELHGFEHNSYLAWLATHFNDPLARYADSQLARMVRYRQIVNKYGRFVGESVNNGFFREAVEARRTAFAYLHWLNAAHPSGQATPPWPEVAHGSQVKIISQRSPSAFFSLSYGAKILGLIELAAESIPTNAFMSTPCSPAMIGLGAQGNPTAAQLVAFSTNATGFDAEIDLTNGSNGSTRVLVRSSGESVAIVEVPLNAVSISTGAGSFTSGIENDPLTGGSRRLEWTGGSVYITNRSGVVRNVTNDWVCVAGRYGMAAGPVGYFRYQAASAYNRSGGAEDSLQFVTQDQLGPRYAVWFPGRSAAQTASEAEKITWSVTNGVARLTFPGASGAIELLQVSLPAEAAYRPYPLPVQSVSASSSQSAYPVTNAVDTRQDTFWVSQYGPTNRTEHIKVDFPSLSAVSDFYVYPRTVNGGYGPGTVRLVLDVTSEIASGTAPTTGRTVYTGDMSALSPLKITLDRPELASNAVLVVTSAYDRGVLTNNARNVQVLEFAVLERARPGTVDHWLLASLGTAQANNPAVSSLTSDPDTDGVPNLLEFAVGGDPTIPDSTKGRMLPAPASAGLVALLHTQRRDLLGIQVRFERSSDLRTWESATPSSQQEITSTPATRTLKSTFPTSETPTFYRLTVR